MSGAPKVRNFLFRSMAPLYSPGLDENDALVKVYPASWISSKNRAPPGTIGVTARYNFFPQQLGAGYNFFPGSEVSGTIFPPKVTVFNY